MNMHSRFLGAGVNYRQSFHSMWLKALTGTSMPDRNKKITHKFIVLLHYYISCTSSAFHLLSNRKQRSFRDGKYKYSLVLFCL